MTTRFIAALLPALILSGTAMADQCAWIDKAQVDKLTQLEANGFSGAKSFVRFCAPCGDATATVEPIDPAKKFTLTKEDDQYWSISYGTEGVDLAYWYVAKEGAAPATGAQSLAVLAGCPITEDTPKTVDVAADGKASIPKP